MKARALTIAATLALLLCGAGAQGDDDKPDTTKYLDVDEVTCKAPMFVLTRPHDGWRFVDLEAQIKHLEGLGEDTKGFKNLRFKLWFGARKAEVYVWSWIDEEPREEPLTTESFALLKIKHLQGVFAESKLSAKPKKARFGKRPGVSFLIEGTLGEGDAKREHAIWCAVCVRPEDKAVAVIQLECKPAEAKKVKKDFTKLLKQLKF